MAKLTIEDLKKMQEEGRARLASRVGEGRARVIIHMGTCGISAGAREVMAALLQEIEAQGVTDVIVTSSGCAGLCSREPMATVELRGQPPVKYVDLNPERMRRIFREHVLGGRIVQEFALAIGSETVG